MGYDPASVGFTKFIIRPGDKAADGLLLSFVTSGKLADLNDPDAHQFFCPGFVPGVR